MGVDFSKVRKFLLSMEMGVPGLEPADIGIEAEIKALRRGVASKYPMIDGIPPLKKEIARFVKNFINIEVDEKYCLPTVGSMIESMVPLTLFSTVLMCLFH